MKIKYVCKTKNDLEFLDKKFPGFFNPIIKKSLLREIKEENEVYIYLEDSIEDMTFCSRTRLCEFCESIEGCKEYQKVFVNRSLKLKRILK